VGDTLGNAQNAAFLYEPLTQAVTGHPDLVEYVRRVDESEPPPGYVRLADLAFSGRPYFQPLIVRYPHQWRFWARPFRRVVIKEINLKAGPWLVERYKPRVIFLVRHPADVLLSHQRLGWWPRGLQAAADFGTKHTAHLRRLLDALDSHSDKQIILYETLCLQPVEQFKKLFEFAQLTWDPSIEQFVRARSAQGDRTQAYDTSRNSAQMIYTWRSQLPADEAQTLRTAYAHYDLPWYRLDDDW
jgi:hypothetical protein